MTPINQATGLPGSRPNIQPQAASKARLASSPAVNWFGGTASKGEPVRGVEQAALGTTALSSSLQSLTSAKPSAGQPQSPLKAFDARTAVSTPAVVRPTPLLKPAVENITQLATIGGQLGSLRGNLTPKTADKIPQSIVSTNKAVAGYIESKMPTTDSWLYKNTAFVDNPTVQKIAKVNQTALSEVTNVAPVTTSAGNLARDMMKFQVDKVPQDVAGTQSAMTKYFEQKMPTTDSWLYKATGVLDKPAIQKFISADQKVLSETAKVAPVAATTGTLIRDIAGRNIDKLPEDITKARAAMTTYFTDKMPTTDSWLYKSTSFIDNPTMQKFIKADERALDGLAKVAPSMTSAGALARDIATGHVTKIPEDITKTRTAMTNYFAEKMPTTDSWLYKNTSVLDTPIVQRFVKANDAMLNAVEKTAPTMKKVGDFFGSLKQMAPLFSQ